MKIEIKLIPDGLDLAKEIQDGMPIDQMTESEEGFTCPIATQDVETNEENQRYAIKEVERHHTWFGSYSPEMQQCMKDESGEVGYCQLLKFMCSAANSCAEFEEGGPMTSVDYT